MGYSLRRLEPSDAPALFQLMADNRDRFNRYFPLTVSNTKSPEAAYAFLQAVEQLSEDKLEFLFGMFDPEGLMGLFFIKTIDWRLPKCELAYCIDRKQEGKGITSKFLRQVLEYCTLKLGMRKIFLLIGLENERSRRLAESAGFVLEGVHRSDYRTGDGDLADLAHYALLVEKEPEG